ncbi:MAG TPA: EF-Tu/IF-2/RF-3 family GTPase [archaeon]|nr:EF-Tu/IF-2/RF-3 family GTPase [archaeon]
MEGESFTVAVLGDASLGRALAKAATTSDIELYHKARDGRVYTFLYPKSYPEKPQVLFQCLSVADAVVFAVREVNAFTGEQVVAVDSSGVTQGIVLGEESLLEPFGKAVKGTTIAGFKASGGDPEEIYAALASFNKAPREGTGRSVIDHYFDVKGVGTVALGFVSRGELRVHEKLKLLPAEKFVEVRSIQMQDEDAKTARAGDRFGIALKGAGVEDLERGSVLSADHVEKPLKELVLSFRKNPYYKGELAAGKKVHVCIGMQSVSGTVSGASGSSASIALEKGCAAEKSEKAFVLDLNSKGLRVVGVGVVS